MYLSVRDVAPRENYELLLTFENGEKRIFNMIEYLDFGLFQELKDTSLFKSVHVVLDSIEWANGADLDPEELFQNSIAVSEDVSANGV